mgnify:CR=1 FL=1
MRGNIEASPNISRAEAKNMQIINFKNCFFSFFSKKDRVFFIVKNIYELILNDEFSKKRFIFKFTVKIQSLIFFPKNST